MKQIIITDLHNVIIDGVNSDDIFAAIRNNPEIRERLETDALNWGIGAANAYRTASDVLTVTADRDRLAAMLAEASAAFDEGDVAKLTAMRAAALQTENEKKLAAALAKKAEAEAEIASLTE